jgi:hypothetical protein
MRGLFFPVLPTLAAWVAREVSGVHNDVLPEMVLFPFSFGVAAVFDCLDWRDRHDAKNSSTIMIILFLVVAFMSFGGYGILRIVQYKTEMSTLLAPYAPAIRTWALGTAVIVAIVSLVVKFLGRPLPVR